MNEELQKQIAAILKQALEAAQHGGQWMAGQVPDVLHQLIVWTVVMGAISAVGAVLVVAVTIYVWVRLVRWIADDRDYGDRVLIGIPVGFVSIGSLVVFALLLDAASDGLKAFVAPKLFLLEYAAHLVK